MSNPMVNTEKLKLESGAVMNEPKLENNPLNTSLLSSSILLGNVNSCSTAVANGLSQQIIEEMNLLIPNILVRFNHLNVSLSAAVFPYLQKPAQEALAKAIRERGITIRINSAYRTIAQQLILFNHAQNRRCGIRVAARPGRSNHQSGLAIDIEDALGWRPYLERHGWRWLGPQDPPHFNYETRGTRDIRSLAVLAFQKLWNKNNINDPIAEDSLYGPQVEARLNQSPVEGFGVRRIGNQMRTLRLTNPLMQGADVREVQQALVNNGFAIAIDGFYGRETERAVRQFQTQTGLAVDGIFGAATRNRLLG